LSVSRDSAAAHDFRKHKFASLTADQITAIGLQ
jgi:hypothetical protein